MKTTSKKICEQQSFWLLVVLILLVGFWLRLTELMRLPLFLDEAMHIDWARTVMNGRLFVGLRNNKWLYPLLLAPFNPTGPESPWLARSLSAYYGLIIIASCIAIGKTLACKQTGLLAGLLYAILPFAVFHERQALVDPLMSAYAIISLVLMIHMARRPRLLLILPLSCALAGAYLTKSAALPYLMLPVLSALLLSDRLAYQERRRALGYSALAIAIAIGAVVVLYHVAAAQGEVPGSIYQVNVNNLALSAGYKGRLAIVRRLEADIPVYFEILSRYVSSVSFALIIVAVVVAGLGGKRREILFLAVPGLVFALIPLLAERPAGYLAPRYLHSTTAPLVVLMAVTILWLCQNRKMQWVGLALSFALIGKALFFDALLISDPRAARLPEPDQIQYQTGDPSGYGHADVAAWLQANQDPPINLLINGSWERIAAYLGPRSGAILPYRDNDAQRYVVAGLLAAGEPVYFAVIDSTIDSPDPPFDTQIELLQSFEINGRLHRLYQITGAGGPSAETIYARIPPEPGQIDSDIEALSGTLGDGPVVIYPARFEAQFASYTGKDILSLDLDTWPPDAGEVMSRIDQLPTDPNLVNLVLVNEIQSDPERQIVLAFEQNLYRVDEAWFGLLHRIDYVTGPANPPMETLDATFEDVIELQAGAILDREVLPGAVIQFAFQWETPVPVQDSFVVFVHLIGEDGTLWAQHDSVPGSGLLPLTSWEPGQPIIDRFAISLPPDIPPGDYTVRMGLYHPDSGLRLRVSRGQEVGPDDVVVGRVTVMAESPPDSLK